MPISRLREVAKGEQQDESMMLLTLSALGVNIASASSAATAVLKFDASSCCLGVEIHSPASI